MQVYMHHIFGPGDFLVGEGAEHRGSMHHPPLQAPYYTTIPADKFTPKGTRSDCHPLFCHEGPPQQTSIRKMPAQEQSCCDCMQSQL